jgi:hypothetical protein
MLLTGPPHLRQVSPVVLWLSQPLAEGFNLGSFHGEYLFLINHETETKVLLLTGPVGTQGGQGAHGERGREVPRAGVQVLSG